MDPANQHDGATPPPEVKFLGSHERGMVVIGPTEGPVLSILRKIDSMMRERRVKVDLDKWISEQRDNSVRLIQGGRMEIFLHAAGKSSLAFDTIIGHRLPPGAKPKVLKYARKKAREDPRLRTRSFSFSQFSLISSFDPQGAQSPHIDCTYPNYQFGLAVSEGATGTMFFEPQSDHQIQTVRDIIEHWQKLAQVDSKTLDDDETMSPSLINAIKNDSAVKMLVASFGDVLFPARHMLYNMKKETNLPTGALVSLPGGVVHAAPPSPDFRSVIFFSGCPKDHPDAAPYNPDTQVCTTVLCEALVRRVEF